MNANTNTKQTDYLANISVASLLGVNFSRLDVASQLNFGSNSVLTLVLINVSCAALGVFVSRPYYHIFLANSERRKKWQSQAYFPVFMTLLSFLNVAVVSVIFSNFKNLDAFVLFLSSLVFFLFGFCLHGEIELESTGTRSSLQKSLWGIFDNSLPTFLPAILSIYLVLVPGEFLLVRNLPIFEQNPLYRNTTTFLLLALSVGAYVLLSRVYPERIEISQGSRITMTVGRTFRWGLFVLGFFVFDKLLDLAIAYFRISGVSEFFFLIAVGVVPYRIFGAVYAPISGWSKAVGIVLAIAYLVAKSWNLNLLAP